MKVSSDDSRYLQPPRRIFRSPPAPLAARRSLPARPTSPPSPVRAGAGGRGTDGVGGHPLRRAADEEGALPVRGQAVHLRRPHRDRLTNRRSTRTPAGRRREICAEALLRPRKRAPCRRARGRADGRGAAYRLCVPGALARSGCIGDRIAPPACSQLQRGWGKCYPVSSSYVNARDFTGICIS